MAKDWTKLQKKYSGLWVALADDDKTVLGVGKTVKEALFKAQNKSSRTPFLTRMPQDLATFVGIL